MARARKAPVVSLTKLLARRFPDLSDPAQAVLAGWVLVDGRTVQHPAARVRGDARLQVRAPHALRGHTKLTGALDALRVDVSGAVCLDVGAAAGGFTAALLDRQAARVYALDTGFGQLTGRLRAHPRVVNLERTNLSDLDESIVPEPIDVVTIDLSYLPLSRAVGQLEAARFAIGARLLALVKPTFELQAGAVVTDTRSVREAIQLSTRAIGGHPWRVAACTLPAVTGAGGAIEAFVLATRVSSG